MTDLLDAVEMQTSATPTASVIWLHGLGADGHDFEPIVPELVSPGQNVRFIFPHAPVRPVTINGGIPMRAWYDIVTLDRGAPQDEAGIRDSALQVVAMIERENDRGIPTERIILAGFSQGGAIALHTALRYPGRLAGIVGLSCYMLLEETLEMELSDANRATPIFMGHGTLDPMVLVAYGESTRARLDSLGYSVEWHTYPMPHAVCPEEIAHLRAWLAKPLSER